MANCLNIDKNYFMASKIRFGKNRCWFCHTFLTVSWFSIALKFLSIFSLTSQQFSASAASEQHFSCVVVSIFCVCTRYRLSHSSSKLDTPCVKIISKSCLPNCSLAVFLPASSIYTVYSAYNPRLHRHSVRLIMLLPLRRPSSSSTSLC